MNRIGYLVCLAGLCFIAALFRVVPTQETVFGHDEGVVLLGVDAYFHVRHAEFSTRHFPEHLREDPASHYPALERQDFSGLYNLGIAAAARVLHGRDATVAELSTIAAWSPIALTWASIIWLFVLLSPMSGRPLALLGTTIFVCFPGFYLAKTALGFADQHAAEVFLAIGVLWGLHRSLGADTPDHWIDWTRLLGWSLPLALFSATWIGYPLFLAFAGAVCVAVLLVSLTSEESFDTWTDHPLAGLGRWALGALCWFILIVIAAPDWALEVEPDVTWLAAGALVLMAMVCHITSWMIVSGLVRTGRSAVVLASLVASLAGWLFVSRTAAGETFWFWMTWVRDTDVAEQRVVTLGTWLWLYGPVAILAAASPFVLGFRRPAFRVQVQSIAIVVFSLLCVLIWMRTRDFDYLPAAFQAILLVFLVSRLRSIELTRARTRLIAAASVVLVAILWMTGTTRVPWMLPGESEALVTTNASWFGAMSWLRSNTDRPGISPVDRVTKTESWPDSTWGVFSIWDHGNIIALHGRRLPAHSRYPTPDAAYWLTETDEAKADSLWCPPCRGEESLRYGVFSHRLVGDLFLSQMATAGREATIYQEGFWNENGARVARLTYGPAYSESMVTRIMRDNGSGLGRFRVVWDAPSLHLIKTMQHPDTDILAFGSDPLPDGVTPPVAGNQILTTVDGVHVYDVYPTPSIRIVERVEGTLVTGVSAPSTAVTARIRVHSTGSGGSWWHVTETASDSIGHFALRLPYPTDWTAPGGVISTEEAWLIQAEGSEIMPIRVSESMVTSGDSLRLESP